MHFIFDRDGTIIKDMHYLSNPNDVELLPKAKTTLHKLKDLGHDLHIHTNHNIIITPEHFFIGIITKT